MAFLLSRVLSCQSLSLVCLMGLEPTTLWLKVRCSSDWATNTYFKISERKTNKMSLFLFISQIVFDVILFYTTPINGGQGGCRAHYPPKRNGFTVRRVCRFATRPYKFVDLMFQRLVRHMGLEPLTPRLKGECSANWANATYLVRL